MGNKKRNKNTDKFDRKCLNRKKAKEFQSVKKFNPLFYRLLIYRMEAIQERKNRGVYNYNAKSR
jgi:hypothetical protein